MGGDFIRNLCVLCSSRSHPEAAAEEWPARDEPVGVACAVSDTGFQNSDNISSALFLLGRYYESKGEYDKAFSAYSDVAGKFPKSPEAGYSRRQLDQIAKFNPKKTKYIPDANTIKQTDRIDIKPEIDITSDNDNQDKNIHYSISLGPFNKIGNAREMKDLLNKDFQPVEIAKIRNGYMVYIGKYSTVDSAMTTKIRLAEELGMNSNIVRVIKKLKNLYIYEE